MNKARKIKEGSQKLENFELWQVASRLAAWIYGFVHELPEEEKWGMQSKLRYRALDMTSDIAEGYGSHDPRDKKHFFNNARRSLFGIKSIYHMAHTAGYAPIDPDIMVNIETLSASLESEMESASSAIPQWLEQVIIQDKKR